MTTICMIKPFSNLATIDSATRDMERSLLGLAPRIEFIPAGAEALYGPAALSCGRLSDRSQRAAYYLAVSVSISDPEIAALQAGEWAREYLDAVVWVVDGDALTVYSHAPHMGWPAPSSATLLSPPPGWEERAVERARREGVIPAGG